MTSEYSPGEVERLLDAYLDARTAGELEGDASRSPGLDPDLVSLVEVLGAISDDDWDRVAPLPETVQAAPAATRPGGRPAAPSGRLTPLRGHRRQVRFERPRPVFMAAAAATVVAALLIGIGSLLGAHSTTGGSTDAGWHLSSFIVQPSWQLSDTGTLGSQTVVCPVPKRCYATDPGSSVVELSVNGGSSWSPQTLPNSSTISTGLACLTPQDCLAGGSTPSTAADRAPTAQGSEPEGGPAPAADSRDPALSSSDGGGGSANSVGGTEIPSMLGTADGGGTWKIEPLPAPSGTVVDASCGQKKSCLAAVNLGTTGSGPLAAMYLTSNSGKSWTAGDALPATFQPSMGQGLTCTGLDCVMVGATGSSPTTGAILTSADGGMSWSAASLPASVALVTSVSCIQTHCVAVGKAAGHDASTYGPSNVLTSADGGQTWRFTKATGLAPTDLWSLSCSSLATCWVSGQLLGSASPAGYGFIGATTNGGASWTSEPLPTTPTAAQQSATGLTTLNFPVVTSVSCANTGCMALATQSSVNDPQLHEAVLTGT